MKKHILLIDDDRTELSAFMAALSDIKACFSFKCTYAGSSRQGLEMLKYIQPDYIFIGYNLEEINGLQVLSSVRSNPSLRMTKVFLYMDTISDEVDKIAGSMGASGCIEKKPDGSWRTDSLKMIFNNEFSTGYIVMKKPVRA